MNRWAASGEKQTEERSGQFWEFTEQNEQRCSEHFVVCLRERQRGQSDRRKLQQSRRGRTKAETRTFVASVDRT